MPHDPMHSWADDMWSFPRSITGEGVRQTIRYLQKLLPGLEMHATPSGTEAFDWTVPDEWNISNAFIADAKTGDRLINWQDNNLHVVGYSEPVDRTMTRDELEPHLHSLPNQPDAIPYVTSYYKRDWGFCLTQNQRDNLGDGPFYVVIHSELKPGFLNYAELIIPGESKEEVLLSTYICHPMMANNELSGPVVTAALARWLQSAPRRYTYRIIFIPETIGAIVYLSHNLEEMKRNTVAGFQITCVGDDRDWSYLPSRNGNTLSDRAALGVLCNRAFMHYEFSDRGSDERQWCAPGVDLPICSIMRSKYDEYPEYHTSLDNLAFISQTALEESFDVYKKCLQILDANHTYNVSTLCEPFFSKYGLYPSLSMPTAIDAVKTMSNFWTYCDGTIDLLDIADKINVDAIDCIDIANDLEANGVIEKVAGCPTR